MAIQNKNILELFALLIVGKSKVGLLDVEGKKEIWF